MPTSALLVMDMQRGITQSFPDDLVGRGAAAVAAARAAGVPVIFVTSAWRATLAEVSPRNVYISRVAGMGWFFEGAEAAGIDPRLAPDDGETVVVKRRVGAFAGSDLELVLRAQGIDTLVLLGIGTSGVVLSTYIQAAEADYGLVVLADCCGDGDAAVHEVLTTKVFPAQAQVLTGSEWAAALG